MYRRVYFLLALVRLYLALQPSYLHPDEHFQGPEVIAGRIFDFPVHESWEFTSSSPIRSAFALWPVYGLPMIVLRWLSAGFVGDSFHPLVMFRGLRIVMFLLSFILEDWAIHELVESRQQRRVALMLVASSYVTWTWQAHTFSNAVETIVVLWSIVFIKRLARFEAHRSTIKTSAVLAVLLVFGTFNRITFPAFVLVPLLQLAMQRPGVLALMAAFGAVTASFAIVVDSNFYAKGHNLSLLDIIRHPVITPLNSLLYNSKSANLALHGTHPYWQHFAVNLPQLLGPAILLLTQPIFDTTLISALVGTFILSIFPHQEARFLLPAVPLILSSVQLPRRGRRAWITSWIIFNSLLGILMGVYHQGGIVQSQAYLRTQPDINFAYWWKTYSPPTWILGDRNHNLTTEDLMGLRSTLLESHVCDWYREHALGLDRKAVVVAPYSATFLDQFVDNSTSTANCLILKERWSTKAHLNLDDMDFGDDGIVPTLSRVVGRRGIVIYDIEWTGN